MLGKPRILMSEILNERGVTFALIYMYYRFTNPV